jgi:predicted membrane protein
MPAYSQRIVGISLLSFGVIFLLANLFDVNIWLVCFPVFLIIIGLWYLIRPSLKINGKPLTAHLIGDVRLTGDWNVVDQEIWSLVGDVKLDFTQALIQPGITTIRIYGFVGEVNMLTPENVGVSVSANGFLVDAKLWETKQERFLSSIQQVNSVYNSAERRLHLETYYFVSDIKVEQVREVISMQ